MCGSCRKSKKKQKGGKKAAAAASRGNFAPRPAHSQRLTPTRMSPKSRIQKKEIVLPLERTPRGRAFALASFFHSFLFLLFLVFFSFQFLSANRSASLSELHWCGCPFLFLCSVCFPVETFRCKRAGAKTLGVYRGRSFRHGAPTPPSQSFEGTKDVEWASRFESICIRLAGRFYAAFMFAALECNPRELENSRHVYASGKRITLHLGAGHQMCCSRFFRGNNDFELQYASTQGHFVRVS